ncbi:MAG: hypothetical protein ACOX53_00365 [Limnochordia bacterium]
MWVTSILLTWFFGTDAVDIVFLPGAGLPLQHEVLSSGRLLFSRDADFLS